MKRIGLPNIERSSYINALINQFYDLKHFREVVESYEGSSDLILALKYMFSLLSQRDALRITDFVKNSQALGYTGEEKYIGDAAPGWYFATRRGIYGRMKYEYILSGYTLVTRKRIDGYVDSLENIVNCTNPKEDRIDRQFCCAVNRFYSGVKFTSFPIAVSEELDYKGKRYCLKGVIVRLGRNLKDSHCVSYKMDEDGKWYSYNDLEVKEVTWDEVKREAEINGEFFRFAFVD